MDIDRLSVTPGLFRCVACGQRRYIGVSVLLAQQITSWIVLRTTIVMPMAYARRPSGRPVCSRAISQSSEQSEGANALCRFGFDRGPQCPSTFGQDQTTFRLGSRSLSGSSEGVDASSTWRSADPFDAREGLPPIMRQRAFGGRNRSASKTP